MIAFILGFTFASTVFTMLIIFKSLVDKDREIHRKMLEVLRKIKESR